MIKRLVKLSLCEDSILDFKNLFNLKKNKIRSFEGCLHLEVWQDCNNPSIFFTYSIWRSENALNKYRSSLLFKSIWPNVKPMFKENAEAWSVK